MTLRLAHVAEFFPFIFKSSFSGKETGIYIDMWCTAAKSKQLKFVRGTDYGGYTVDPETGQFSGLLGLLQNASVDGIAEDFTYRSSRKDHFYATVPIDWTVENFYERADPTSLGTIESFVVFPPLLLYLFVTSALLVIVVERVLFVLRHRFRVKYILRTSPPLLLVNAVLDQPVPVFRRRRMRFMADAGSWLASFAHDFLFLPPTFSLNIFDGERRTLSFCIYLIAILSIVIIYSAVFAGIASSTGSAPATAIKQLVNELSAASRTLLVQNEALIKDATALELFGSDVKSDANRFREMPEIQDQIDLLCSSDHFVSFVTLFQTFSYRPEAPLKFPCSLQIIDTSDYSFPPNSAIAQDAYGKLTPVTFYFGKHLGRKFKRWFDQVILRMFSEDTMVDYWWRRYTNRPRRDTTVVPLYTYSPVPMRAFRDPLIVCGSLMALAVVVLGLELIHKRFSFHRRALKKITTILPQITSKRPSTASTHARRASYPSMRPAQESSQGTSHVLTAL